MDIMKIVNQAIEIITKPKEALKKYKDVKVTKEELLIYLGIVTIPTLLGYIIGYGVVGIGGYGWSYKVPIGWAVGWGIAQFILMIIGVIVFGYVFNMLAQHFSSKENLMQAMKLVTYAITPVLIAGILNVVPGIGGIIVFLALLYSLYILYLGLPIYMGTPEDKRIIYLIVAIIVYFVIMMVISWLVSSIMWGLIGYNPYVFYASRGWF